MKNKNNLLWLFMIAMMFSSCSSEKNNTDFEPVENVNDTMFVVGISDQPSSHANLPKKYMSCVNKYGQKYYICAVLSDSKTRFNDTNRNHVTSFIERGDTIIVENGYVVRNLTMEHMIERYVNGQGR